MAKQLRPYRLEYTKRESIKIDKDLQETNVVYGWLREKYNTNQIRFAFKIHRGNLYSMFEEPYMFMTLERLFIIMDLMPEREPKDILKYITNSSKAWYELETHEIYLLRKKLKG